MPGEIKQRTPGSWQIRVFLGRDERGRRIRKNETIRGRKSTRNGACANYSRNWTGASSPRPSVTNLPNGRICG